jgi:Family of unknown function (DUF5372)
VPVRVTHPFHPLFGQVLDIVVHRHDWGEDRIYYRDGHGLHCFIHHPRAIEVLSLAPAAAFLLTYLFYERNLKPPARRHLIRLALAARLREDLALATSSGWPAACRSD